MARVPDLCGAAAPQTSRGPNSAIARPPFWTCLSAHGTRGAPGTPPGPAPGARSLTESDSGKNRRHRHFESLRKPLRPGSRFRKNSKWADVAWDVFLMAAFLRSGRPRSSLHFARFSRAPGASKTSKTFPNNSGQTACRYPVSRFTFAY